MSNRELAGIDVVPDLVHDVDGSLPSPADPQLVTPISTQNDQLEPDISIQKDIDPNVENTTGVIKSITPVRTFHGALWLTIGD